jgi:hypothetical protein
VLEPVAGPQHSHRGAKVSDIKGVVFTARDRRSLDREDGRTHVGSPEHRRSTG